MASIVFNRFILPLMLILVATGPGCQKPYAYDGDDLPETVDFNFHVKPILSDRCFACHGPDANMREAGLRLDLAANAIDSVLESGGRALVPGSLRRSEVFHRITSDDAEERMPPAESNLMLEPREIAILSRWIEQGADYKPHWAFLSVEKPAPPLTRDDEWARNPIDQFTLSQLEARGLAPEPEADRETLLRRLTLDLTGLPPNIAEIDAFLADDAPDAYEQVVDRLLRSNTRGERMAQDWLDVARYADSHGYSLDGYRSMWPWRDWVIGAFNQNLPYDQFVTWQLAGDLLPNATQDQRLATAFLKNHRLNSEGGIVPEEYMVEYAVDRTVTAGTAFMGLTMECARCHDHKYDPISQKEFYEMLAYFNNVNEVGEIRADGNDGPQVLIANDEQAGRLTALENEIASIKASLRTMADTYRVAPVLEVAVSLGSGLLSHLDFDALRDNAVVDRVASRKPVPLTGDAKLVDGYRGTGLRFTPYEGLEYPLEDFTFDRADPFAFSFWVNPSSSSDYMSLLMKIASKNDGLKGYEVALEENRLTVHLISSFPSNRIEVRSVNVVQQNTWTHVAVSYTGSGDAEGVQVYLNGRAVEKHVVIDQLEQTMVSEAKKRPLRIGYRRQYQAAVDEGHAILDELRIYDRSLTALEAAILHDPAILPDALPEKVRRLHHLEQQHADFRAMKTSLQRVLVKRNKIQDGLEGVMVMEDLAEPRPTYILARGAYDAPEEQVSPGILASVLPAEKEIAPNRLGLAQWLLDERHPLTARIAVNRYWQMFFGRGIVETTEDFGSQGALPSHPALLDWLAATFIESDWDIRALQKMVVMSATYRQASTTSPEKRATDSDNVWLSRGPSHRLSAEMLRDQALAASGLLNNKMGGRSVKPYQPPGLWAEKSEFTILKKYEPDTDGNQYRRSLYTFWRRTSPPPAMTLFDAPARDNCTVRRQRTSTPLQALVLLNDPQFVEAARVLAERVMIQHPSDTATQITQAYRMLSGKKPDEKTLDLLVQLYTDAVADFQQTSEDAASFLSVGEAARTQSLDVAAHAALAVVVNMIMSFDEVVNKK